MNMPTAPLPLPVHESTRAAELTIRVVRGRELKDRLQRWERYARGDGAVSLSCHPAWMTVLEQGFGHEIYCLEACEGETIRGILPLAHVSSFLFGRFLVSLPYLNQSGVMADDDATAARLIDRAVELADELRVRYLELRHGKAIEHPCLADRMSSKVHMRLSLPKSSEVLWKALPAKVRNQVRKGQKNDLTAIWGGVELLGDFHRVFSENMRDLGTPTFGKKLFASILGQFPNQAELCIVKTGATPVAGALLLHGWGVTEVPSASCLRKFNHTCANMLMYWQLLERAIQRQQEIFDFGRSSRDGATYRFKEQWGAKEAPAEWRYYVREGGISDMRPENPRYQRLIRIWQKLPLALTRLIGPRIVRGIP